ncbi:hypothetical protein GRI43_00260 [Altererythrobacter luteolus]|uniref:Uncharacterized protein n=1 Tax=Pontixanthobacter luteolus TaxID=295089 RepID=A0A6I4V084_9SPHN|nr:hypothetical protein [Pontixanthobacter luteolus]MXP45824.1 hypothetical protein [Pontixanthobacter luteolus]
MRTLTLLATGSLVAAIASSVSAAPDNKPIHAATQTQVTGCIVRGTLDQPFQADQECEATYVVKRNKDGRLIYQAYRDKGTLQPGQEIDTAFVNREEFMIGDYECKLVETAQPSGKTSSFRHCRLGE